MRHKAIKLALTALAGAAVPGEARRLADRFRPMAATLSARCSRSGVPYGCVIIHSDVHGDRWSATVPGPSIGDAGRVDLNLLSDERTYQMRVEYAERQESL